MTEDTGRHSFADSWLQKRRQEQMNMFVIVYAYECVYARAGLLCKYSRGAWQVYDRLGNRHTAGSYETLSFLCTIEPY